MSAILYSATTTTTNITNNISTLCQDNPVILLGESHEQPKSQMLFLSLVLHYSQDGGNVFVGLEIPIDQQFHLEATLLGATDFSYISSIIDHPAYRAMIHSLGAMKKNVTIKASDARADEMDRDKALSRNIKSALSSDKYDKILVLVGSNHVIKHIKWHEEGPNQKQKYLAGYLIADGIDPCSIQQLFRGTAGSSAGLVMTDTERGSALAMEVIRHVNHSAEMTGGGVSDAVVEWKCYLNAIGCHIFFEISIACDSI